MTEKTVVLTMRTSQVAKDFVDSKAKRLGITKNEVMKRMFTYAAKCMTDEDYR